MSFTDSADVLNDRHTLRTDDVTGLVDELVNALLAVDDDAVALDELVDELDGWLDVPANADEDDLQYYIESARKTLDEIRKLV